MSEQQQTQQSLVVRAKILQEIAFNPDETLDSIRARLEPLHQSATEGGHEQAALAIANTFNDIQTMHAALGNAIGLAAGARAMLMTTKTALDATLEELDVTRDDLEQANDDLEIERGERIDAEHTLKEVRETHDDLINAIENHDYSNNTVLTLVQELEEGFWESLYYNGSGFMSEDIGWDITEVAGLDVDYVDALLFHEMLTNESTIDDDEAKELSSFITDFVTRHRARVEAEFTQALEASKNA